VGQGTGSQSSCVAQAAATVTVPHIPLALARVYCSTYGVNSASSKAQTPLLIMTLAQHMCVHKILRFELHMYIDAAAGMCPACYVQPLPFIFLASGLLQLVLVCFVCVGRTCAVLSSAELFS
jgi:hypothetical protein